jgi:two-component system NarL family sensor kinase
LPYFPFFRSRLHAPARLAPLPLKTKLALLAGLPLLLALLLIALVVKQQEEDLARRERAVVEQAYMKAREVELRHYLSLALTAIRPLYTARGYDPAARQEAIELLRSMNYGSDGYYFVYDMAGRSIMHPRQPELVGEHMWNLRDDNGMPVIQALLNASQQPDGGFVRYLWRKPSTGKRVPKLGYVIALDRWGWMLGTGLYLDDIEATLAELDGQVTSNITQTLIFIAAIAVLGMAVLVTAGAALNWSEHRLATSKLQRLAHQVVRSQEGERAHLARELHDGTSQTLVSVKLLLESAIEELQAPGRAGGSAPGDGLPAMLPKALDQVQAAAAEVRRISHRLRPAMLDLLGLPAALEQLGREFAGHGGLDFSFTQEGGPEELPEDVKTVYFRVAQEALTNIAKHAGASRIGLALSFEGGAVCMQVSDDGRGFDVAALSQDPRRGIGLRNMRERLASLGGACDIESASGRGTRVTARLRLAVHERFREEESRP